MRFRSLDIFATLTAFFCVLGLVSCKQKQDRWLADPIVIDTSSEHTRDHNVVPTVKPLGTPTTSNVREHNSRTAKERMLECICRCKGREINCQFINRSSSCILYDHQVTGPEYYLDYIDKKGKQRTESTPWVDSVYFPHLVALSPYPADNMFPQGAMHSFNIPVPSDCKKILSLTFLIGYVPFSEMDNIRDIGDLAAAFLRNKAKVTATFE